MSLRRRLKSFAYALQGLVWMVRTQPNARFHLLATAGVVGAAAYFRVSAWEWVALVLCIAAVIAAEAVNTAIEQLTDLASPDFHPLAGRAKDLAAGAVLVVALGAAVVGGIILAPHFRAWFFCR